MVNAYLRAALMTAALGTLCLADDGDKPKRHIRLGGISVGAGYSHFGGPWSPYGLYGPYGPYGYYGGYSPLWALNPFVHPLYYSGFGYMPNLGEVRLRASDKTAEVFLDGALAGKAGRLRSMWLEPGAYQLEIRSGDRTEYSRKIYVLTGKRFDVDTAERSQR